MNVNNPKNRFGVFGITLLMKLTKIQQKVYLYFNYYVWKI